MKSITVTLLSIGSVAICGLALLQWRYAPAGMVLELVKALLNLLAVAVVTPIVAFLIARYNDERAKQNEADKIRHQTLDVLNETFMTTKKIRRRVRARMESLHSGEAWESRITKQLYFQSLERLNDVQLRLEVLAKDVESHAELFPTGKSIFVLISSMEEYLNSLIDEWEHVNAPFEGSPAKANIEELPSFADLVGDYRKSKFRPAFVHSYYQAVDAIRRSLITVRAATWKERGKAPSFSPAHDSAAQKTP